MTADTATITPLEAGEDNYIWILEYRGRVTAIDPTEGAPVVRWLERHDKTLSAVAITHFHHDHIGGLKEIVDRHAEAGKSPTVYAPALGYGLDVDARKVYDGDRVELSGLGFRAVATPGHAPEHTVYRCSSENLLFAGDALFPLGCGRLFGPHERAMLQSLDKLRAFPIRFGFTPDTNTV